MSEPGGQTTPFRWDLVTPDRLGSLLGGLSDPDLWFLDSLVECAGKVLARSGGGDLFFVGRSLDSMFDLLSGALANATSGPRSHRLPFSFARTAARTARRWQRRRLTAAELGQAREILKDAGLAPDALARRTRPVIFADVVDYGSTFAEFFRLLRDWITAERAQWDVIRRKVRFVGVTSRQKTSPNTFRWQQHAEWTALLPAQAVRNVSLDDRAWGYFANSQVKLTRSFTPDRWLADAAGPDHADATRQALAEAVALVGYGRSAACRGRLAQVLTAERAVAEPWARSAT